MRSWALSCSTARVCIIMPTRSIPEAPKLGRCFSIVGRSRTSRADIVLVYIMAHRPRIAAGFVTVCCQSRQLLWQHMHGLSFTHKSWAESLECIHGPEVTSATMYTVCESAAKQCPSWSIVEVANNKLCCHACFNLSHLHYGLLSSWRYTQAVALHCHSQLS